MRGISSTTTTVQHPPRWCDGSHSAPERPPHTSYRWRGGRAMKPISVWGWLGGRNGQRPVGKFGVPLTHNKSTLNKIHNISQIPLRSTIRGLSVSHHVSCSGNKSWEFLPRSRERSRKPFPYKWNINIIIKYYISFGRKTVFLRFIGAKICSGDIYHL